MPKKRCRAAFAPVFTRFPIQEFRNFNGLVLIHFCFARARRALLLAGDVAPTSLFPANSLPKPAAGKETSLLC